jgi:DNA helicase II / ATP-dependent DNA helicase PcrA
LTTVADEVAQARYIAQQILRAREEGVSLKEQIVLFRASHHSAQLEAELSRCNIPFRKYGGLKFIETAHVKDVFSLLRWCENPRDRVAAFRSLQLLPGIGPSTAAKILDKITAERKVVEVLSHFPVPKASAEAWSAFTTLIARLRKSKAWPAEFQALRAWYEPHLPRLYEDSDIRAEDIGRLQQIAAGYRSRQQFLTELAIDPPDRTGKHAEASDPDEEYTILATIHWAKGGEWKIVRVLNVVDGCIPSARAEDIEEERRLLHVAMTRAKDQLDLINPQSIFKYQQGNENPNVYSSRSRFIPKSIHDAFEMRRWGEREGDGHARKSRSQSKRVDIAAAVERMWL